MTSATGDAVGTVADEDIQTVYLTPADRRLQDEWVWPPSAQSAPLLGALERCLDPIGADEFFEKHYEREALHIARGEEGRFDDLLSVADVSAMVSSGSLRYPGFRLAMTGVRLEPPDYTLELPGAPNALPDVADTSKVLTAFDAGATVALQGLQYTHPPLQRFCRSLEAELAHRVQANAYFSPSDAQAFGRHYDSHDVFSLQVAGEKRWQVFEPSVPLAARGLVHKRERATSTEPILDVVLQPGDTLYLPSGWPHEVFTSETLSLGITIGVMTYRWLDAFHAAVDDTVEEIELRREVPVSGAMDGDLSALLADRLTADQVAQRRRTQFVLSRRPVLDGQLADIQEIESLTPATSLERLPTVIADLYDTTLVFEGKSVRFPDHVHATLVDVVTRDGSFTASDLPGVPDDESGLAIVARLIREGFLRRSR